MIWEGSHNMKKKATQRQDVVMAMFGWLRRLPLKKKVFLAVATFFFLFIILVIDARSHHNLFVIAETVHAAGILILIYKLTRKKTCSGLSLKSQELTAIFLLARLSCSFFMEADIHTLLDFVTLAATLWVIYMIRFKLKSSYIKEQDNMPLYYTVVPAAVLAFAIHPVTPYRLIHRILWAFCTFLESVSVLPQLRLMQNAKMVEPFTGHYVFALGIARFLGFAYWIIRIIQTRGRYFYYLGSGLFWLPTMIICEFIQSFVLADFCYYYVKSVMDGQLLVRLPCPV